MYTIPTTPTKLRQHRDSSHLQRALYVTPVFIIEHRIIPQLQNSLDGNSSGWNLLQEWAELINDGGTVLCFGWEVWNYVLERLTLKSHLWRREFWSSFVNRFPNLFVLFIAYTIFCDLVEDAAEVVHGPWLLNLVHNHLFHFIGPILVARFQ